jgi:hypothetical protein
MMDGVMLNRMCVCGHALGEHKNPKDADAQTPCEFPKCGCLGFTLASEFAYEEELTLP